MEIEGILLKLNDEYKFEYSLDELIKSNSYIKEIGEITDLFFNVQIEYSKKMLVFDNEKNKEIISGYNNRLINDNIDIDGTKYTLFLNSVKPKIKKQEYINAIERITATNWCVL